MMERLSDEKLFIYTHANLNDILHTFPYKTKFTKIPTFFYPYTTDGIDYVEVPTAIPFMIKYLKGILRMDEIAQGSYSIHDVHNDKGVTVGKKCKVCLLFSICFIFKIRLDHIFSL